MIFRRRNTMRKVITVFAILLAVAAGLTGADKPTDTGEFKTLIQHYWEAWSTLNPDNAASMYAKETDAVFYDLAPLKYNGWEEYKAGVKKVFAGSASATIVPNDDLRVTRRGKVAWTSNTFHGTIHEKDGKNTEVTGRHTAIWEKRGAHWIIVHEHVSAPLPG
jgi:ketosteroid isomerase-like protein